jgi:hypothetical protein
LVKVLEALGVSLEEFFREGFELMDEWMITQRRIQVESQ